MSKTQLQALPSDLSWSTRTAYLLLDGVSVENLPQRLYQWYVNPDFEVLYLETPWAGVSDLSPCLIRLEGPQDPALNAFVQSSHEEWGYLLFSSAPRNELLSHLRWLLQVRHPLGEEMLLRVADPAVMHALLEQDAMQSADITLLGPIEHIVAPDKLNGLWHQHYAPAMPVSRTSTSAYPLSEEQLHRLGQVSFRNTLIELDAHMQQHFPDYQRSLNQPERWAHLKALAEQGYAQGFESEHDLTLYANIFGLLGDDVLKAHGDIAALLTDKTTGTPSQRVEQAANLAFARAQPVKRTS